MSNELELGPKAIMAIDALRGAIESLSVQLEALSADLHTKAMTAPAPAPAAAARPVSTSAGLLPTNFPNYGRSKGAPIAGASQGDLEYYANGARRSIADPAKARFHDKERALLAAVEAEIARAGGSQSPPPQSPPPQEQRGDPGPTDDDIPF